MVVVYGLCDTPRPPPLRQLYEYLVQIDNYCYSIRALPIARSPHSIYRCSSYSMEKYIFLSKSLKTSSTVLRRIAADRSSGHDALTKNEFTHNEITSQ